MKTRAEIEDLKKNWRSDPCWDIADTEGFEDHREELTQYQLQMEAQWAEQREGEKRDRAHRMGLEHPSKLADYISGLEWRIDQLLQRIDQLEDRNDELQRRLDQLDRSTRSLL